MKMTRNLLLLLIVGWAVQGCTSFEATLAMEETAYPISMNELLYSDNLEEIGPTAYRKVGSFKFTRYMTGLFHGKVPLTQTDFDLSDDINEAIKAKGGNAMVNFRAKTSSNAITTTVVGTAGTIIMPTIGIVDMANKKYVRGALITALGFALPNISKVVVKGDIVVIEDRYLSEMPSFDTHQLIQDAISKSILETSETTSSDK